MRDVHTFKQYRELEQISNSRFYKELRDGTGVEVFYRGKKGFVREEARQRHHAKLEQQARAQRKAATATVTAE